MSRQTWKPGTLVYPVPAVLITCKDDQKENEQKTSKSKDTYPFFSEIISSSNEDYQSDINKLSLPVIASRSPKSKSLTAAVYFIVICAN